MNDLKRESLLLTLTPVSFLLLFAKKKKKGVTQFRVCIFRDSKSPFFRDMFIVVVVGTPHVRCGTARTRDRQRQTKEERREAVRKGDGRREREKHK